MTQQSSYYLHHLNNTSPGPNGSFGRQVPAANSDQINTPPSLVNNRINSLNGTLTKRPGLNASLICHSCSRVIVNNQSLVRDF